MTRVQTKSVLADALRQVNPRTRRVLGISDSTIVLLEILVVCVRHLMEDSDDRQWHERLGDLEELLPPALDVEAFTRGAQALEGLLEHDFQRWQRLISTPQGRTFLRRLAGASAYDKVEAAIRRDGALIVIALRRLLRWVAPVAVALDDSTIFLSQQQMRSVGGMDLLERSALNIAYQIDALLDRVLDHDLPLDEVPMREEEARCYQVDVQTLAEQLRPLVSGKTQDKVNELSAALSRKMTGARQALATSDDGASQAANSLIEFIDRLLRQAFDEAFVMEWLKRCYPLEAKTLYEDKQGNVHPTKRAQALCFAHGGRDVEQGSAFHKLAAAGLQETRDRLQKIKHSDKGTAEEKVIVEKATSAVEGFFLFSIRVGWAGLEGDRLEVLKQRL